jgi:hypothetical protein
MFTINATSNKSASSDSISSMSSMSMSPTLSYLTPAKCPSPKPANIVFGTADHVEPLNLKKLEDGEIEDKDRPFCLPPSLTLVQPTPIPVNHQEFSNSHTSREVEALDQATDNAAAIADAASSIPQIVRAGGSPTFTSQPLAALYRSLRTIYRTPPPESTPEKDVEVKPTSKFSDSDNDADDDDEDSWSAWRPSSPSPPQGDANHPPSQWVCGEHPGMGWELNDVFTTSFYRIQIPDPTTNRVIVAPYISYAIQRNRAEVQGTYGKGYPIITRLLEPIPVDYYCPPITPEQMIILDAKAPFANVVNKILNDKFPLVISAAVRRYQYYQEEKYAAQAKIRRLQERENQCLEKAMCVLSDLENTNILGRLACFEDEVYHDLTHDQIAAHEFLKVIHTYTGVITTSALDAAPNPWRKHFTSLSNADLRTSGFTTPDFSPGLAALQRQNRQHALAFTSPLKGRLDRRCSKERNHDEVEASFQENADAIEERLRRRLHVRKFIPQRPKHPLSAHKRCFKCGHMGHIRAQCYNNRRPIPRRK